MPACYHGAMRRFAPLALLLVLAACSTPNGRIREKKDVFAAYPPDVQAKIRAGKVDVGFTQEMTELALGRPTERYTAKDQEGAMEIWLYGTPAGHSGVGLTVGAGSGPYYGGWGPYYGVGVGMSQPDSYYSGRQRVVFRDGKVVSFEKKEQ